MKVIQKSEAIKASLQKRFQDDSSTIAWRWCYGYYTTPNDVWSLTRRKLNPSTGYS